LVESRDYISRSTSPHAHCTRVHPHATVRALNIGGSYVPLPTVNATSGLRFGDRQVGIVVGNGLYPVVGRVDVLDPLPLAAIGGVATQHVCQSLPNHRQRWQNLPKRLAAPCDGPNAGIRAARALVTGPTPCEGMYDSSSLKTLFKY